MPIVEVTHDPLIATALLRTPAETLPNAVSLAVECPEEPYDGMLQAGDVKIRFRPRGPHDSVGWTSSSRCGRSGSPSRAVTRQERCDQLRDAVVEVSGTREVGVYLSLPVAAWAQGD